MNIIKLLNTFFSQIFLEKEEQFYLPSKIKNRSPSPNFFFLKSKVNKISLQNTLQFFAFCTPLKIILINYAIIQIFLNCNDRIEMNFTTPLKSESLKF
ncbi:hypothetical protein BpHYR1_015845 [Brachionus plicatilis]|uniref:Uncharacterized protein n=1 Tax=Brachionus plicatilis TaxID=10195 RepID=A0A3M7P4H2_BRAPC|nr:hypothetical protein BpHYR1_015845 [Brachionus plicatilis]